MTIPELFDLIKNTAGTNKKKEILVHNMNPVVQQIFEDTYSDKKYFVKKYNITKSGTKTVDENYKDFAECLYILANRYKTGNAAVSLVEHTINQFEPESQEILKAVLAKKLTIGISRENFLNATGVESEELNKFLVSLAFSLDKVKGVNPIDGTYLASRKLDGCVTGDTIIQTKEGTRTIKEIVEKKLPVEVLSYNVDTKQTEYKKVIGYSKNLEDISESKETEWFEIETEDGRILKVTGNHPVYIPKLHCYRRVDELNGDEEVLIT
ncbi:MAG: hypothetical protein IKO36_04245 [Bacteroidaceae bacterium]|nr:hypothetical protein [Bacteroidaceae bacterium]